MSEIILYAARRIVTMEPTQPHATHVAVRDGRILAVGGPDCAAGWGTVRADDRFRESVLLPGFVEAHSHQMTGAVWDYLYCGYTDRTDPDGTLWPGVRTPDELIARLSRAMEGLPEGKALIGWGFDPLFFDGERLNRLHLDRASADRPIAILHQSGHLMTVNTPTLALAQYTPDTNIEGLPRLPDGSLDATFGNGGIAAPASPTYKKLFGGISLTDGRIMAWGEGSDISLFKFVTDPQADRFADLGPDVIGCQGDSVLLDAGSGYATYAWSTGDSSQAIHASSNSDFIVTLTDQDECMDMDTVAVTMVAPPATPTITVNGLDLSTTATGQLQWYFNGTSIAGATQATHTASANGDYTVTVTDSVGCASASATVTITGVGVQELGRRMISVHPNPTSGPVTVQGVDPASVASITLMDMTGKVTFLEMGRNGMLDVSSMASGVYFLQLIERQARRATARLVVR